MWTLECVLRTCVWLRPGKAAQELTGEADLALEHVCSIELVSQVSPDLLWGGAALVCDYQEDHWGNLGGCGCHNPGGLPWEKKNLQDYLWLCGLGT